MISADLEQLSQPEIYALICECLYALKDNPKYSITSELAFILEKDSFVKFIKYFGGMTITVPTMEEFKDTIGLLLLYQAVEVDKGTRYVADKDFCRRLYGRDGFGIL